MEDNILRLKRKSTLICFRNRILKMRFGLNKLTRRNFSRLDNGLKRGHLKSIGSREMYEILHKYINMSNNELFQSDIFIFELRPIFTDLTQTI